MAPTGASSSSNEKGYRWVSIVNLPRTPEVFEEELTSALDEMSDPLVKEATNYHSVEGYEDQIRILFEEEAADWVGGPDVGRTSKSRVREGPQHCSPSALQPLLLWWSRRRSGWYMTGRVRDCVRSPTAEELRALMRQKNEKKNRCKQFILVEDVSKAHRRVMVRRQDWGVPGTWAVTRFDLVDCGGHVRGQVGRIPVVEIIIGVVGPFDLLYHITCRGAGRTTGRGRHFLHCWEQTRDRGLGR